MAAFSLLRDETKILVFQSKIIPAGAYINYNAYSSQRFLDNPYQYTIRNGDERMSYVRVYERKSTDSYLELVN